MQRTVDGSWTIEQGPTTGNLWGISLIRDKALLTGWAVGETYNFTTGKFESVILAHGGATWKDVSRPTIGGLAAIGRGVHTWVGGLDGALTYEYGSSWAPTSHPFVDPIFAVDFESATGKGWAVGDRGAILRFDGTEWQPVPSPTHAPLYDVVIAGATSAWAVGWDATVLHYADGLWQKVDAPIYGGLKGIDMVGEHQAWMVGGAGGIFSFAPPSGTAGWIVIPPDVGGVLTTSVGVSLTLDFPALAVSQPATVTVTLGPAPLLPAHHSLVGTTFAVSASTDSGPVIRFDREFTLTVHYTDAEVAGKDEGRLALYRFANTRRGWERLPTQVDPVNNLAVSQVDRPAAFALLEEEPTALYLPALLK